MKPGDVIAPANASMVEGLVSPGNLILVKQGMSMKIVPTGHLDWPPPYKAATEQYSPQVSLSSNGDLRNYVAGLPFPLVDANDPDAAIKIMWNFTFRPLYTDDLDERAVEILSHRAGWTNEVEHFTFGHLGLYKYVGRTEVAPMPTDPDVLKTGIVARSGVFPILEPAEMRGAGIIRERYAIPGFEDAVWEYSPSTRRLRRLPTAELSDLLEFPPAQRAPRRRFGGHYDLRLHLGSRFRFWFCRKNPRLHLPTAERALDARVRRGRKFSRPAMRQRRWPLGLP